MFNTPSVAKRSSQPKRKQTQNKREGVKSKYVSMQGGMVPTWWSLHLMASLWEFRHGGVGTKKLQVGGSIAGLGNIIINTGVLLVDHFKERDESDSMRYWLEEGTELLERQAFSSGCHRLWIPNEEKDDSVKMEGEMKDMNWNLSMTFWWVGGILFSLEMVLGIESHI